MNTVVCSIFNSDCDIVIIKIYFESIKIESTASTVQLQLMFDPTMITTTLISNTVHI